MEISFNINYIKEVYFSITPSSVLSENQREEDILVDLKCVTGVNAESDLLKFSLKAWYHLKDDPREIAAIVVDNLFTVQNIKGFIGENNKVSFPPPIWAQIVGICIGHTRALFTKSLAGTFLERTIIPIMNPLEVAQQFFPESFEKQAQENMQKINQEEVVEEVGLTKTAKKKIKREKH